MQEIKIKYNGVLSIINATIVKIYDDHKTLPAAVNHTTLSDTDPSGALQFTIAVVILYGVGVIGLLGITARRNRRLQMMDKEVNEYLGLGRRRERRFTKGKTQPKPKKVISKLISMLHTPLKLDENQSLTSTKPNQMHRSRTWTEGMNTSTVQNNQHVMPFVESNKTNNNSQGEKRSALLTNMSSTNVTQASHKQSTFHHQRQQYGERLWPIDEDERDHNDDLEKNDSDTNLIEVRIVTPTSSTRDDAVGGTHGEHVVTGIAVGNTTLLQNTGSNSNLSKRRDDELAQGCIVA